MKVCTKCGKAKEFNCFHISKKGVGGVAASCKECRNAYTRMISHTPEQKAKNKINAELWRERNIKHYRERNAKHNNTKEKKEALAAWHKANPGKSAYYAARYKAARAQATPNWLNKAHHVEMEGFYQFCKIFEGFAVDHIVPLRGKNVRGLHVPWNLQILTREENSRKNNKHA